MPPQRRSRGRGKVAMLAPALLILLGGCTEAANSVPDLNNEPPYWCELIPKEALSEVQGLDDGTMAKFTQSSSPSLLDSDHYGCSVAIRPRVRNILSISVDRGARAREQLPEIRRSFQADETKQVPTELGRGEVAFEAGWLYWRCGQQDVLIDLDLLDNAKAQRTSRNAEVIAMLSVAQERYAQIRKCSVGPPGKAS